MLDEYNREREERLNEFIKRGEVSLTSENAAKDFARECRNRGGTSSSIRKDVDQEALQNCLRYNVREGSCQVQSFARYFVRCTK